MSFATDDCTSRVSAQGFVSTRGLWIFGLRQFGLSIASSEPIRKFFNVKEPLIHKNKYAHDASGITVIHNLLGNSDWGIRMRVIADRQALVTDQSLASHGTVALVETSNEHILENFLIDNYGGAITLPPRWRRSNKNISDFNTFINTDSMMLSLLVLNFPSQMEDTPAVVGVDKNFFGQLLPEKNSLPGPFQDLHSGENYLLLTPAISSSGDQ